MKKNVKIVTCSLLSMMLTQMSVYAADNETDESTKKDETVYAMLHADGSIDDEIISSWIHNESGIKNIKETLDIKNVENVKGDEQPSVDGNAYTWNLDGNDVYYQGNSDKKLPVDVKITYVLDGVERKPEELAGKSGKLEIHIEMKNTAGAMKQIQGKEIMIHSLYLAAGVIDFNTDHFQNVTCEDAKVLSDGNNQIVGFASIPGFEETLQDAGLTDTEKLPFHDTYVVKADVKDFEMGPIMIAMTPEIPLDRLKDIASIDELTDGIDALGTATNQLFDGTSQLADATTLFSGKMGELHTSVQPLSGGITTLNLGAKTLYEGSTSLRTNLHDLDAGLSKVKEGTSALAGAATKLPDLIDGTGDIKNGAAQLDQGIQQVAQGIEELQSKAVTSGQLEQLKSAFTTLSALKPVLQNLNIMIEQLHMLHTSMNVANIDPATGTPTPAYSLSNLSASANADLNQVNKALDVFCANLPETGGKTDCEAIALQYGNVAKETSAIQTIVNGTDQQPGMAKQVQAMDQQLSNMLPQEQLEALTQMSDRLDTAIQGINELETGITQLAKAMPGLKNGSTALSTGTATLHTASSELSKLANGVNDVNTAVIALQNGSTQLYGGSQSLESGLQEVSSGTSDLANQTPTLLSGIAQLQNASVTLSDKTKELNNGMDTFKSTGIDPLSEKVSFTMEEVNLILSIKDEMIQESEASHTFSGAPENAESEVKFIYKTEEIKKAADESTPSSTTSQEESEDTSFWERIVNFFTNLF